MFLFPFSVFFFALLCLSFVYFFLVTFSLYVLHSQPVNLLIYSSFISFSFKLSLSTRTRLFFGQEKHFLFTPCFLDSHEHHTSMVAISFFFCFFFLFFPQNAALSHLLTLQVCAHFSHTRHQIISDRARRSIISTKPHRLQIFLFRPVTATFKKPPQNSFLMSPTEDAFCVRLRSCLSCEAYCVCIACRMRVGCARRVRGGGDKKNKKHFDERHLIRMWGGA